MSRNRKRRVPQQSPAAARRPISPLWAIAAAAVLAGVPFVLGKYMEFNSPDPFDSGAYVYSAQHILQGARLGVDETASAQPGTLLVNIIGVAIFGFSETGPKIIQMLLQMAALALMFHTVRRLFGSVSAVLSVTIAAVYLSAPVIAKYGNVKEQHMIAFMVIGACCFLLYQQNDRWWLAVCAAAAAVNAYYFKQTGASVVIAMVVYSLAQPLLKNRSWRDTACDFMLLISGAIIGLVPLAVLHMWQGQADWFMGTEPIRGIILSIAVLAASFASVWACRMWRRHNVWSQLRTVRRSVWVSGAAAMLLVFTPFAVYFICTGDLLSYLRDIPFIKVVILVRVHTDLAVRSLLRISESYVGEGWAQTSLSQVTPQVLRYYNVLLLPILLAAAATLAGLVRWLWARFGGKARTEHGAFSADRVVLLLAVWWILDTAFVWISPRSYEQYYLPLNASAAMLAGYVAFLFAGGFAAARNKMPWLLGGTVLACVMIALVWPIFAGQTHSPDTGSKYDQRRRGYAQRLEEAAKRRQGQIHPWEAAGDYIRQNSNEDDVIYVWGWVPGIYVRAQRFSPSPTAFESEMHVVSPAGLSWKVQGLLDSFVERPPRFIVDTRKRHFPAGRLPLELWPQAPWGSGKFLPPDQNTRDAYDREWARTIADRFGGPAEAERYAAMAPFREYVMSNYTIVGRYGEHVLFVRKGAAPAFGG